MCINQIKETIITIGRDTAKKLLTQKNYINTNFLVLEELNIMNGKKAKLLRKYGTVAKKTKKVYNSLSHQEKSVIADIYEYNIARRAFTKEQKDS